MGKEMELPFSGRGELQEGLLRRRVCVFFVYNHLMNVPNTPFTELQVKIMKKKENSTRTHSQQIIDSGA